jgi:hypothetical protein
MAFFRAPSGDLLGGIDKSHEESAFRIVDIQAEIVT